MYRRYSVHTYNVTLVQAFRDWRTAYAEAKRLARENGQPVRVYRSDPSGLFYGLAIFEPRICGCVIRTT